MRKIWLLAFSFLIFLLSFTPLNRAFATSNVAAAQELSPTSTLQVNYELPYPGLLPDSPLYILKVARDKVISFLISDAFKKAEFDLLQADKRLNAGIYLFNSAKQNSGSAMKNEKKINLAISTISKAENYFEQAIEKTQEAKNQGRNINEMEEKLRNAVKKHKQELGYITQKATTEFKTSFEREQKRVTRFEERLNH